VILPASIFSSLRMGMVVLPLVSSPSDMLRQPS
jgi:hypothetical protein